MTDQNSILDKVMESQERQQAAQFNPNELISGLLKNISHKEGDILSRRFGLLGKNRETLEQIGKYYDITRERIRQIETATIKKIKELKDFENQIEIADHHITRLLENSGGVMEENYLLDEINYADEKKENYPATQFILTKLLNDKFEAIKQDEDLLNGWRLPTVSTNLVKEIILELVTIVEKENRLIGQDELLEIFRQKEFYKKNKDKIAALRLGTDQDQLEKEVDKVVNSYLKISKKVDQNILNEWGIAKWNTITPKRMSDKVYLILRKTGKPLHFTEITELINQANFDKKVAYPATIHNELILDDRFVLVGRGIYALKEWGYKTGTVMDIIVDVLTKAGEPMTKDEIIKQVLDQRLVRKSTIYLALTNKEKINKLKNGTYALV